MDTWILPQLRQWEPLSSPVSTSVSTLIQRTAPQPARMCTFSYGIPVGNWLIPVDGRPFQVVVSPARSVRNGVQDRTRALITRSQAHAAGRVRQRLAAMTLPR
jgi:hypothetical protein